MSEQETEQLETPPNAFVAHIMRALRVEHAEDIKDKRLIKAIEEFLDSLFAHEESPVKAENDVLAAVQLQLDDLKKRLQNGDVLSEEEAKEFQSLSKRLEAMETNAKARQVFAGNDKGDQLDAAEHTKLVSTMLETTRNINIQQAINAADQAHKNAAAMLDRDGDGKLSDKEKEAAKALGISEEKLNSLMKQFNEGATSSSASSQANASASGTAQDTKEGYKQQQRTLGNEKEPEPDPNKTQEQEQRALKERFRKSMLAFGFGDSQINHEWEKMETHATQQMPLEQLVDNRLALEKSIKVAAQFIDHEHIISDASKLVGATIGRVVTVLPSTPKLIGALIPSDDMQPAHGLNGMSGKPPATVPEFQGFQPMGGRQR